MRIGKTQEEKFDSIAKWHEYFAWFPVDTIDGGRVWLQMVYRKALMTFNNGSIWSSSAKNDWEYRVNNDE